MAAIKEVSTKRITDLEWKVGDPFEIEPKETPTWERVLGKLVKLAREFAKDGNGPFGTGQWGPMPDWAARSVVHGWYYDRGRGPETDQKALARFIMGLAHRRVIADQYRSWNEAQKLIGQLWSEVENGTKDV